MKKLMSMLLAFVLCLGSSQVFAVKRTEDETATKKRENVAYNCTFEEPLHEHSVGGMHTLWSSKAEWQEGGANGSKGCLKVKVTSDWGYVHVTVPYQETIGETFDFIFWGRIDEGTQPMDVYPFFDVGYDKSIGTDVWTTEWKQYKFTYTNDGTDINGKKSNATELRFAQIWCGNGRAPATYYLDDVQVIPHGNVEFNEYFKGPLKSDSYPAETGFDDPVEIKDADFSDMNGHWAEDTVDALATSSFVNGFGDGTYGPEKSVTRAEFVKMAMNILRYDGSKYTGAFSDVKEGQWFAQDIENANAAGLIDKALIKDGKFLPDEPITREEAASIIAKIAKIKSKESKGTSKSFTDKGSISDWAKASVDTAVAYGLINGYPNGSFGPDRNITRAEAASMFYRAIELSGRIQYFVDGENGSDENDGSKTAPFKTVEAARDAIRPTLSDMQSHIFVNIKGGDYHLNSTVKFTTEDSGQNGYYVVYTSWGDEKPVFNMGETYTGFNLHDEKKGIYKTYLGANRSIYDVFINDIRTTRARSEYLSKTIVDVKTSLYAANVAESMLINPEKNDNEGWIICDNLDLLNYARPQDLEFTFHTQWCSDRCQVDSITKTEDGRVKIQFNPDNFYTITNSAAARATFPEYIENAYELLDSEGEYYYNKEDGYLYYKPRKFEDPKTMVLTIPTGETAFLVAGDSVDEKAHNLRFENLGFEYTTCKWYLEEENFFKSNDRAGGSEYAGDGRITGFDPDAAFITCDIAYVDIVDCEIARTGGSGLTMRGVFQYCNILGNHIYDISGTALNIGHSGEDNTDPLYRITQPSEYKYYRCYNLVKNNLVHDYGHRFESSHGIHVSFVKNTTVTHNEIYGTNYMGIVVGGGLNGLFYAQSGIRGLEISNNYVHDTGSDGRNYDCGSIYFAGPSGGTEGNYNKVINNYLENHRANFGTLYFDTATRFYELAGNVTDLRDAPASVAETFIWAVNVRDNYIHDNYSTTSQTTYNQPDNKYTPATIVPDANWPAEAQATVDNAGLTPEYLEKYPDSIQHLKVLSKDYYSLKRGESVQFEVTGFMRKLNEQKLDYSNYNFFSSNDKVAKIDENGLITATGKGSCHVFCEYLDGTILRRKVIQIACEDEVINIIPPAEKINVVMDTTSKLSAIGITSTYSSLELEPTKVEVVDESIAKVDANGVITPVSEGYTDVKLTYEADGVTLTHTTNIRVVIYNNGEETREFLKTSRKIAAGDPILDPNNWKVNNGKAPADAVALENGGLNVNKAGPAYCTVPVHDEVISFDLTISSPTSWPSLIWESTTLNATTSTSNATGDLYLFGWGSGLIELQKFIDAKHIAIFGYPNLNPVAGPGFPNTNSVGGVMGGELYNYDVTYSITVGSIPVEGGERLILIMNGMPIYDYVDPNPVEGGKYLGVYNDSGTFKFEPFTDQRFLGYED